MIKVIEKPTFAKTFRIHYDDPATVHKLQAEISW